MAAPVYTTKLFDGAVGDGTELFTAPTGFVVVLVDLMIGALVSTTPSYVKLVDSPTLTIGWANWVLVGEGNFGLATAHWTGRQCYETGDSLYVRTDIGSSFLRMRATGYLLTT